MSTSPFSHRPSMDRRHDQARKPTPSPHGDGAPPRGERRSDRRGPPPTATGVDGPPSGRDPRPGGSVGGGADPGAIRLRCLPEDARILARRLPITGVEPRELPGSEADAHLEHLIGKPWGHEQRVYDDALVDVWLLSLRAGAETSQHCHPRKDTFLLCLRGNGVLTASDASTTVIEPGCIAHIEQGAGHRTHARSELELVEIETPRDKRDLVRSEDVSGRRGRGYEGWEAVRRLLPALEVRPGGPPLARVRPACATGEHRFEVEHGRDMGRRPDGLQLAVCLDTVAVMRRRLLIAGPQELGAMRAEDTYLTIRTNSEDQS